MAIRLPSIDKITTSKTQEINRTIGVYDPDTPERQRGRQEWEQRIRDTEEIVEIFKTQGIDLSRASLDGFDILRKQTESQQFFSKCHLLPTELITSRAQELRTFQSWVLAAQDTKKHYVTVPANRGDRNKIAIEIPHVFGCTKMHLYYAVATRGKLVKANEIQAARKELSRNVKAFGRLNKYGVRVQLVVYEYTIWERLDVDPNDPDDPKFLFHVHANIIYTMDPTKRAIKEFWGDAYEAFGRNNWRDSGEIKDPVACIKYVLKSPEDSKKRTLLTDRRPAHNFKGEPKIKEPTLPVVSLERETEKEVLVKVEILPPGKSKTPEQAVHEWCKENPNTHDFGGLLFENKANPDEDAMPDLITPGTNYRAVEPPPWERTDEGYGVVYDMATGPRKKITPLEMGRVSPETLATLYHQTFGVTLVKSDNEFARYKKFLDAFSIKVKQRSNGGYKCLYFEQVGRKSLEEVDEREAKKLAEKEKNEQLKAELKTVTAKIISEENAEKTAAIKAIKKDSKKKSDDINRDYQKQKRAITRAAGVKKLSDLTGDSRLQFDQLLARKDEECEQIKGAAKAAVKAVKEAAKEAIASRKQAFLDTRNKRLVEEAEEEFKQKCLENGEKYLDPEKREIRAKKFSDYEIKNKICFVQRFYDHEIQAWSARLMIIDHDPSVDPDEDRANYNRHLEIEQIAETYHVQALENGWDPVSQRPTGIVGEYSVHYLQALTNDLIRNSQVLSVNSAMDYAVSQYGLCKKLTFVESDAVFLPKVRTDFPDENINKLIRLVAKKHGDLLARAVSKAAALWFSNSNYTKKLLKTRTGAENSGKLNISHWLDNYHERESDSHTIEFIDDDIIPYGVKPPKRSCIDRNIFPSLYTGDRQWHHESQTDMRLRGYLRKEFEAGRNALVSWHDNLWLQTADCADNADDYEYALSRLLDPNTRQQEQVGRWQAIQGLRELEIPTGYVDYQERLLGTDYDPVASGDIPPPPIDYEHYGVIDHDDLQYALWATEQSDLGEPANDDGEFGDLFDCWNVA